MIKVGKNTTIALIVVVGLGIVGGAAYLIHHLMSGQM